jgi:uncharacterized membrane protein
MSDSERTAKRRKRRRQTELAMIWFLGIVGGLSFGAAVAAFIAANLWWYGYRDAVSQYAPLIGCVATGLIVGVDVAIQQTRKLRRMP